MLVFTNFFFLYFQKRKSTGAMSGQQGDQEVVVLRPNHFGIMRSACHRVNKTFFKVKIKQSCLES